VIESLEERIRELESELNSEGIQQLKEENKVERYTNIEAKMYHCIIIDDRNLKIKTMNCNRNVEILNKGVFMSKERTSV